MTPAADSPRPERTPWHLRRDTETRWVWFLGMFWLACVTSAATHHAERRVVAAELGALHAEAKLLTARLDAAESEGRFLTRLCAVAARMADMPLVNLADARAVTDLPCFDTECYPTPVPAPVVMEPLDVRAVRAPLTDPRLAEHGCSPEGDQLVCNDGRWWPEGRRP